LYWDNGVTYNEVSLKQRVSYRQLVPLIYQPNFMERLLDRSAPNIGGIEFRLFFQFSENIFKNGQKRSYSLYSNFSDFYF